MVKCLDGVMVTKKGTTRENIIKKFTENCAREGHNVKRVIHCLHIGDNAWRIVANVEIGD